MKIITARNPKWSTENKSAINVEVLFDSFNNYLPFTARSGDSEAHGRELYSRALSGEFGVVAEYTPPPPLPYDEFCLQIRGQRDFLLEQSDWSQLPDVPLQTKELWSDYRQQLRDIPTQSGFPYDVQWPAKPA